MRHVYTNVEEVWAHQSCWVFTLYSYSNTYILRYITLLYCLLQIPRRLRCFFLRELHFHGAWIRSLILPVPFGCSLVSGNSWDPVRTLDISLAWEERDESMIKAWFCLKLGYSPQKIDGLSLLFILFWIKDGHWAILMGILPFSDTIGAAEAVQVSVVCAGQHTPARGMRHWCSCESNGKRQRPHIASLRTYYLTAVEKENREMELLYNIYEYIDISSCSCPFCCSKGFAPAPAGWSWPSQGWAAADVRPVEVSSSWSSC